MIAFAVIAALVLLVGGLWAAIFAGFRPADVSEAVAEVTASPASDSGSGSGGSSDEPSSSSTQWSMDDAREAFAQDGSRLLVLGDGTGDGWDEWAFLVAEAQGLPGAMWMAQTENGYSGVTEETRLWSGGMPESTADYPLEHWDAMWPEATPDLVLLNYGHNYSTGEDATQSMEELRAAIAEQAPEAPIVVTLQNPQADDANADVREAIGSWAQESGLPTIDVAGAFADSGILPANLRLDTMHPSTAGSQLWAETVEEALAG